MKRQFLAATAVAALCAAELLAARTVQPAEPEIVTVPSGSLQLKGLLWRPQPGAPAPAVLFHHGGGCANVQTAQRAPRALGPRFVAHGYAFLWVYRRGGGLSHGQGTCAFEEIRRVRESQGEEAALDLQLQVMTTSELEDAMAGLAALRSTPGIDPTRIAVAGHSFGGQLAVLTAEREHAIRAALNFSGGAAIWNAAPKIRTRLLDAIPRIKVPVFLGYAVDDNAEPGRVLGAEFARLGKPYQLAIYQSGGHGFVFNSTHAADADIFRFLSEHVRRP